MNSMEVYWEHRHQESDTELFLKDSCLHKEQTLEHAVECIGNL